MSKEMPDTAAVESERRQPIARPMTMIRDEGGECFAMEANVASGEDCKAVVDETVRRFHLLGQGTDQRPELQIDLRGFPQVVL